MQRRSFLKQSTFFAIGVGVFGNISWNVNKFTGDTPTTTDVLGPFYLPGSPRRININPPGFKGDILNLSGTIYKDDGITPFKNCLIEVWQCNHDGDYDLISDAYNYRGSSKTGLNGKYHFITTIPVPYLEDPVKKHFRPAHIHMRISGEGQEQDLITQIYFKGDPHISEDPHSSSPGAASRILEVSKNANNENNIRFDLVMRKKFEPDLVVFKKLSGLYLMEDKTMTEFYKRGNLLFLKWNGQIQEGLVYKGNNSFEGGDGSPKAQFEIVEAGIVKVKITYGDDGFSKTEVFKGVKYLKYQE
jgi:protocatechuate 3,4-dioxygenase beta subunit